jgi:hypothetical protein
MSKSKVALSLFDLLRGIGKTEEKLVEKIPEAAKVPVAKRRLTEGMLPQEIVDFYNREGMLGRYRTGAPAVADIVSRSRVPGTQYGMKTAPVETSSLPKNAEIRFMTPEELAKPVERRTPTGKFSIEQDEQLEGALNMYPSIEYLLKQAEKSPTIAQRTLGRGPVTRHLTTTQAPPDIGAQGYQLAYDMTRGQGDVNVADILTSRNVLRRPLNAANYGIARGDFRNVMPMSDKGIGVSSEQIGQRVLGGRGLDTSDLQLEYLTQLLGDRDLASQAMNFDALQLAKTGVGDPSVATGYLGLTNAMRSALLGPDAYAALKNTVHPGDLSMLRKIISAEDLRELDKASNVKGAFGPGALGRARTVEAAVEGLKQQMTPDEIVEEITKGVDPSGFFGRYKHGGGVRKYKAGGLSAIRPPTPTPVEAPTPDPLVEMIMRQLGVPAGGSPSPEQLEQFNEMYNRMLEQRRLREETYDYPFREHDAALG